MWDGSIFDVAQRLESAEGFGPPLANGAVQSVAKGTGVSFAPLQTATSTPQAQRQGSGAAPPLRSALRRPQNSGASGGGTTNGGADVAAPPPDASRERLTTEDGNALEPQPLLQGRRGSPKRAAPAGMRPRGSSYDTSPSSSGSGGGDAAAVDSQEDSQEDVLQGMPRRFVSELLPSTARAPASADAAAAVGSLHADAGAEGGNDAALPVQPDGPSAQRLALRRRTSDLIQLSDTGEPRGDSSAAAADDASLTQRAEAHYKECDCEASASYKLSLLPGFS